MNKQILNRFKSFAWRVSMMALIVVADYVINNLTGFGLPAVITIVVGLVAGEVSKFLNTELSTLPTKKPLTAQKVVKKKKK